MELLKEMCGEGEGNISWFPNRMELLKKLMISLDPTILIEIGFNMGHSCKLMCDTLIETYGADKKRTIYCFDICIRHYVEGNFAIMKDYYKNFNINLIFIKGNSAITLPEYLDNNNITDINFVNIDGDHTFDGVTTDYNNLKNRIAINGIIYIDDYKSDIAGEPGIDKAVGNFDWTCCYKIDDSVKGVIYGIRYV